MKLSFLEKIISLFNPKLAMQRAFLRTQMSGYNSGSYGKRNKNWNKTLLGPNAAFESQLNLIVARSRDLVRNNPWARSARDKIVSNIVGHGIKGNITGNAKLEKLWRDWSETTKCDINNRLDLAGIQELVCNTVVESGECLIKVIYRRSDSNLEIPIQLQILECDYIDKTRDNLTANRGRNTIKNGIEYNSLGQAVAYYLYDEHPGENLGYLNYSVNSKRVKAENIIHIFNPERSGQNRGIPWFAPVANKIKDLNEYEDTQLIRQKISACFAGFIYDNDPASALNGYEKNEDYELSDKVTPGLFEILPPNKDIKFSSPPAITGYQEYNSAILHSIAAGLNITYEMLTGDFSQVNYSSARMGKLEMKKKITRWQKNLFTANTLPRIFKWFLEAVELQNINVKKYQIKWTVPKFELVDPQKEIAAIKDEIRLGLNSPSSAIIEMGRDPEEVYSEWKKDKELFESLNLIFDCDPSKISLAGQVNQHNQNI